MIVMGPAEHLNRLHALFDAAVDLPLAERESFVTRECGADPTLRADLERLLQREQQLKGALTQSPVAVIERGLEAAAAGLDRGQQFDPYQLKEQIGSGGMGRVFRATRNDGAFQQEVAIKLMRRELMNPALLKRFSTERTVLAALDHPGISRLIDAGETADGTPYVVMELVRGVPLLDYCDQRRLTIVERVALFRQVIEAVAHAHRNLVVHRDLKPGNVLVTEEGAPKLLDFGIAKPLGGEGGATVTAERFFTPAYAAPEQLRGGPITVGCDVYALGVLLYELLTGRLPFVTDNLSPGEIERLIISVPPPAMGSVVAEGGTATQRRLADTRQLRRQLGGDLEAIVQRALRKEPSARYATVEQLDADLAAYLSDRPVSARPGQVGYRLRKFISRHRLAVSIASAASLALLATLVLIVLQSIEVRRERDRAELERDRAQYSLEFLRDAFTAADPGRVAGADISAAQILQASRTKMDAVFESRPDLFAALATTIIEVQLALGQTPEAAVLAERATLAARKAGFEPRSVQGLLILHARALMSTGEHELAAERLAEAAQVAAGDSPEWRLARARLLTLQLRAPEAIPLLQALLVDLQARPPTDELATNVRWQLAEAFRLEDQLGASLDALESMLRWQRGVLDSGHPRVTLTRLRRVSILRELERKDEALTESRAVVEEVDRVYGPASAIAANARMGLGSVLMHAERHADAAREYRIALEGWQTTLGNRHPNAIRTTFNLAQALAADPAQAEEAERRYREALTLGLQHYGSQRNAVVLFRLNYARFLLAHGRSEDALATLVAAEGLAGLQIASEFNRPQYLDLVRQAYAAAGCTSARGEVATRAGSNGENCLAAARSVAFEPPPAR